MNDFQHGEITEQVIGAAFEVHGVLGYGFLEKVYENALLAELCKRRLKAETQKSIKVKYKDVIVGDYVADLIVEDKVIVELKTEETYNKVHEAQLLNYLKATGIKVGLLINFGRRKCEFRRLVM
ncbi:MAG: GxxExxY protein [Verrucomicrobiia bacterium]|jgi:GxxExxY protein